MVILLIPPLASHLSLCPRAGVRPTVSPLKACSEALLITRCSRASPANARHWPGAALRPHFQGQPMARPSRVNRELMAKIERL